MSTPYPHPSDPNAISEREAFIEAICDNRHDDSPRLAFADWLEERGHERGDTLRAKFIRDQIAEPSHGTWAKYNPRHEYLNHSWADPIMNLPGIDWNPPSTFREMVKWAPWEFTTVPVHTVILPSGANVITWRRGFVDEVECSFLSWITLNWYEKHPITKARIRPPQGEILDTSFADGEQQPPAPEGHVRLAIWNRSHGNNYRFTSAVLPVDWGREIHAHGRLRHVVWTCLEQNYPGVQFEVLRR